jgi:acyl carrier protein
MGIDEIIAALRTFVQETFQVSPTDAEFTDDVHIFDYGYVDSFGAVQIIDFVRDRFNVVISDQDLVLYPLNTIREIATLVEQRVRLRP